MKRKGKFWFFVLALFLILLAVLPITGVTSRFGDTITTIARNAQDVTFGSDTTGVVTARYSPLDKSTIVKKEEVPVSSAASTASEDASSSEPVKTTTKETNLVTLQRSMLITRLSQESITGYSVDGNESNGQIVVSFPYPVSESADADIARLVNKLNTFGAFALRDGASVESDDNILLQNGQLSSATIKTMEATNEGDTPQYYIEATLSDTYAEEVLAALAATSDTAVTFWMDGKQIEVTSVSAGTTENTVNIYGDFSQQTAKNYADIMSGGALSYEMKLDGFSANAPVTSENTLRNLGIAAVVGLGLIIIFMLISYNLTGILSVLCLGGYMGMMLIMLTGFFTVYPVFPVTVPAILAVFLSVGMAAWGNILVSSNLREELNNGKKIDAAIKDGYRKAITPFYDVNFVFAIVAIVLMGAFGSPSSTFGKILTPIFFAFGNASSTVLHGMGYLLMAGVCLNLVFGYCCHYGLVYTITRFEAFRKPSLFGAKVTDIKTEEKTTAKAALVATVPFKSGKPIALLSALIVVAALVVSFVPGVKADPAQTAGSALTYEFKEEIDTSAVQQLATTVLGEGAVVKVTGKTLQVSKTSVDAAALSSFHTQLLQANPDAGLTQQLADANSQAYSLNKLVRNIVAAVFMVLVIMLFMAYRFRRIGKWKSTFAALISMAVASLASYVTFVAVGASIGLSFVGIAFVVFGFAFANVAILYYSLNETRPTLGKKVSLSDALGTCLRKTRGVSVAMLVSLLIPVVSLCVISVVFDLPQIFQIVLPAIVGIVVGYFTSRALSSLLWIMWEGKPLQANASKVQ